MNYIKQNILIKNLQIKSKNKIFFTLQKCFINKIIYTLFKNYFLLILYAVTVLMYNI
ncbi:hypothetical protein STURON_00685 [Spiroplasma turonicum]|uniref:Transmembrane protein n=1 Tax=Spiroplasma turonicum TaxID=216946 RepID=A0A0K1P6I5_9MOLU|nr:hypothetical protein STURON_00685 [Spiroplasma turonicum]